MREFRPLANGLHTDHPVPDLPFVDDSHIPVADPRAIEAIGRHRGQDTWGRMDRDYKGPGWAAFTTDPTRHDLAWCVRWHPDHGRSVVLCRDSDSSTMHTLWYTEVLLFRAGGYWWDGEQWYRPRQIWDAAAEKYLRRLVRDAVIISAADMLDRGNPDRGQVLQVVDIDPDAATVKYWLDELSLWANVRGSDELPLSSCIVTVSAPELTGDQLLGVAELAEIGGVAATTLRAYISRNEGDVPAPQAVVAGRNMWSRPVAEDWAERRRRSSESAASIVATAHGEAENPAGVTDVWTRFGQRFATIMGEGEQRKRFTLRWRSPEAIRQLADRLGWEVAMSIDDIVPVAPLATTLRYAVLDELATGQAGHRKTGEVSRIDEPPFHGIAPQVGKMLGWFVRHDPELAQQTLAEIIGEAEDRLNMPRTVTIASLRAALHLDGGFSEDHGTLNEWLDQALPPSDEE